MKKDKEHYILIIQQFIEKELGLRTKIDIDQNEWHEIMLHNRTPEQQEKIWNIWTALRKVQCLRRDYESK